MTHQQAILAGVTLFTAALAYDVVSDYAAWKKNVVSGKKFDHKKGVIERCLCVLPSFILFVAAIDNGILFQAVVITTVMEFFVYMLLFNGIFGLLIAQDFFYVGTTAEEDKLWSKLGKFRKPTEVVLAVGALTLYLYQFFR